MSKTRQPVTDDRHLNAGNWVGVLRERPGRRSTAVLHLGEGCEVCSESLRQLVGGGETLAGWAPTSDPVILALRRWIEARRHPRRVVVNLRPMHRYWIDRESFGRLDFCRAVVEEGRQLAIDRPDDAIRVFTSLRGDVVCGDRLRDRCGDGVHDLRSVLHAYLVEAWCGVPDLHEAERHAQAAKRELDLGSGDRETLATFYEQQAVLAAVQGIDKPELAYLDAAAGLLHLDPAPGRRAEALLRKGIALLRRGCSLRAAEVLTEARKSLPEDVYPRLLLEVAHRQALAAVRNRDFTEALGHVQDVKPLYSTYPLEPMATQRLWIEGISQLGVDRKDLAEDRLAKALKRYCRLREWGGASQTLATLANLYSIQGREKDLLDLQKRFSHVIRSSAASELAVAGLRKAVHLSTILGVPVPYLRQTLDELVLKKGKPSKVN